MDWLRVEKSVDEGIKIPDNWLYLHYYEALSVLFKVENTLRSIVYIVLKSEKALEWMDTPIYSDDASQTTIGALAKKRIAQSQNYGYLGYQIGSPMMHLTSGELARLLTAESNWPLFKKYFKASKQVVSLKLEEIGTIRISLAHFRPLTQDDVEVVKQNANQVLSVIEETLASIISGGQRVPTNTLDEWYINMRTLGGQQSQIICSQSLDSQWIQISLQFKCPILQISPKKPEKYAIYKVLNVNPVGMINTFIKIREFVTCIMENVPYIIMPNDFNAVIMKNVNFTFGIKALNDNHKELKTEFESLIAEIDKEIDLIKEDNLARWKVAYICSVRANKEEGAYPFWYFMRDNLLQPLGEEDPPEFWGSLEMYSSSFVSDAHRFPWMPVMVSNLKF